MKMFLCKLILSNGSVYYKRAHLSPGACQVFVILFRKSCKCSSVGPSIHTKTPEKTWGLKIGCKCSTPGQHQQFIFQ